MPDLFPLSSHNTICVAPKLDPWDHDFFAGCPDPPPDFSEYLRLYLYLPSNRTCIVSATVFSPFPEASWWACCGRLSFPS